MINDKFSPYMRTFESILFLYLAKIEVTIFVFDKHVTNNRRQTVSDISNFTTTRVSEHNAVIENVLFWNIKLSRFYLFV